MSKNRTVLVVLLLSTFACSFGATAAERGEVIVANNLGLPLWTHNFDSGKTTTIDDKLLLSEFMGAHCFVTEHLRLGMMFQWTEQYTGAVATGADRFTTFALLPQVGWVFSNHLAVAGIFTIAPISGGKHRLDLGVQALVGYGLPIRQNVALNFAVELPYNFHVANTLGVTPLLGLTFRI
jgi:hypothetical protein